MTVLWPTRTSGTSVIAFAGPGGKEPMPSAMSLSLPIPHPLSNRARYLGAYRAVPDDPGPDTLSSLFTRASRLPTAVSASGAWVTDSDGRRYLDAAGGAIVVGIGHGDASIGEAMA